MDLEGRQKPTFTTHQIFSAIINGRKRSHSGCHLLLNFGFQLFITYRESGSGTPISACDSNPFCDLSAICQWLLLAGAILHQADRA